MDGMRLRIGRRQKAFESGIRELDARAKQIFYRGVHLMLMINQGQRVYRLDALMALTFTQNQARQHCS